jgi:8-oxo-dGTP diphosphatase
MLAYNYCSQCATPLEKSGVPYCPVCKISFYRNAKPCASILPVKDGKVLLAKRGQEPLKGAYDIIGGFLHADELPAAGALREAKEETGLEMKIIELLGIYSDQYGEDGDYTLNIHYIGEVIGGEMHAQDDVADLEWVDIAEIPLTSGFKNTREGLRDLHIWYQQSSALPT